MLQRRQLTERAQAATSFYVPDNSPLLTYTGKSWTSGYAAQPNGFDQTLHLTSSSGSRVAFNLEATSLSILVPYFENCTSIISINDSIPVSACATRSSADAPDMPFSLFSLPQGIHKAMWDVGNMPTDGQVVFWGIGGTRPADPTNYVNVTIDDTYSKSSNDAVSLVYNGNWESVKAGAQTDLSEKDSLDKYFNKTLAITKDSGSSVAFTGAGSAIYLYGSVGPDYGSATISVNDIVAESSINLTSPWAIPYELLWFRTGLDPSTPTEVVMTSLADSKMSLDFVLFTTGPDTVKAIIPPPAAAPSFAQTTAGKVVLFFVIPFLAVVLFGLFLFLCMRRRKRAAATAAENRRHNSHASDAEFKFPGSDSGHWSGEPKSSRYSTHSEPSEADLVFVSYDEAKGQRMSEHWNKSSSSPPTPWRHEHEENLSPRSIRSGSSRSPPMELRSLPQSMRGSVVPGGSVGGSSQYHGEDEQSETNSAWHQPFRNFSAFPTAPSHRKPVPADSLAEDDTLSASGTETGSNGKRVLPATMSDPAYSGYNTPSSESASPTGQNYPTQVHANNRMTQQSGVPSITSVFGAPPSENRHSIHPGNPPTAKLPSVPAKYMAFLKSPPTPPDTAYPTSPTTSRAPSVVPTPESTRVHPKSSTTANDVLARSLDAPPSSFPHLEGDGDSLHRRGKSGVSTYSAARPDSVIIPYDDFIASLDGHRVTSPVDDDCFGPITPEFLGGRSTPRN